MTTISSENVVLKRAISAFVLAAVAMFWPAMAEGRGLYRITWYTIDGGGGTSTGGQYVLSGTIGQPDAEWCSGGAYELLGGFSPGGPIGCFPSCHEDYSEWLSAGKPECWCVPTQCHGDADGARAGSAKAGYYYVGPSDLNVLVGAWMVKEPPHGPGIASVLDGICTDFAHDRGGSAKSGYYRVGPSDLNILVSNWLKKEPPYGPGVEPDCLDCP